MGTKAPTPSPTPDPAFIPTSTPSLYSTSEQIPVIGLFLALAFIIFCFALFLFMPSSLLKKRMAESIKINHDHQKLLKSKRKSSNNRPTNKDYAAMKTIHEHKMLSNSKQKLKNVKYIV